jgi:hypothetical protein
MAGRLESRSNIESPKSFFICNVLLSESWAKCV